MTKTRPSVLIVDDDVDILEVTSMVLEHAGYTAATARNGHEALLRLREGLSPCLILLDLMMPVMSGPQFRAEQVADAALSQIPVVVITGDGRAREKVAALGLSTWLEKPVDLHALVAEVERHNPTRPSPGPSVTHEPTPGP